MVLVISDVRKGFPSFEELARKTKESIDKMRLDFESSLHIF